MKWYLGLVFTTRGLPQIKIVKLRFTARRVDIVSLLSGTLSEAKNAYRGQAYKSREDLHSYIDVFVFAAKLLLRLNRLLKNNFWTMFF